jgi:hypothetical protein
MLSKFRHNTALQTQNSARTIKPPLLCFSLPTTHFLSPHLPNFTSFQPTVAEDKRGLPANSPDSLALCSKCSACHCTPSPFQIGRATTQSVSRQNSPQRPGYKLRSVFVGFVVDDVTLGQDFPRVLPFPLSVPFH